MHKHPQRGDFTCLGNVLYKSSTVLKPSIFFGASGLSIYAAQFLDLTLHQA